MGTLYGIAQSPWTHRARWALDHHGVSYDYHEHVPMLGELFLRRAARTKKASVPLFVDADGPVMGSFGIARHAERRGRGEPLFPKDLEERISEWNDVAEKITHAGRVDTLRKLATNREAQREGIPSFVPSPMKSLLAPTAALAGSFLLRKYGIPADFDVEAELRSACERVREGLDGKPYLLGTFTYADIAIATALQALRPHASARLGPGTAASWTHEDVARSFEDLVSWRDTIYAKHLPS